MITVIVATTAVVLAAAVWIFISMISRPMFEPGTVAARIAAAKETFDPIERAPAAEPWRVTEDISLHHISSGQGIDIVFIHGGPGFPPEQASKTMAKLAQNYRVHLYDQRGCGRSTRPFQDPPPGSFYDKLRNIEAKLGLAEQIADLERIRRLLQRDQLILVGHSFGAVIAALYAAEFPDRVRALILAAPAPLFTMPVNDPDLFAQVRERLPDHKRGAYDQYLAKYFDLRNHLDQSEAELSKYFGAFREFYAAAAGFSAPKNDGDAGGFMTVAIYASLGRRHDWTSALAKIRAPALILHGAGDFLPESESKNITRAIPGARLVTLAGAGHFLLDETPDEAAAAILDLLEP